VTADSKPSAHFEHTVVVTKDGYTILTKRWKYAKRWYNRSTRKSCRSKTGRYFQSRTWK
jgi:hypothetical protein